MTALTVIAHGDGAWPDMTHREVITLQKPIQIAGLMGGMDNGLPSVAIRIDLPDGRVVFAETSLRLFLTAADILKGTYGDPRNGT